MSRSAPSAAAPNLSGHPAPRHRFGARGRGVPGRAAPVTARPFPGRLAEDERGADAAVGAWSEAPAA